METKGLTDIERTGRYLCKAYFNGELPPSAQCVCKDLKRVAECVERVLLNEKAGGGGTWLALMSGDLAKLRSNERARQLGVGVIPLIYSIDGRDDVVRVCEVAMYAAVGKSFMELIR